MSLAQRRAEAELEARALAEDLRRFGGFIDVEVSGSTVLYRRSRDGREFHLAVHSAGSDL